MISIVRFTAVFSTIAALFTGLMFSYWAFGFVLLLVGASYIALAGYAAGVSVARTPTLRPFYTTTAFNVVLCLIALLGLLAMFYDRTFLRGLANRVLELAGDEHDGPLTYGGSYVEYVERTGREAPGVHA